MTLTHDTRTGIKSASAIMAEKRRSSNRSSYEPCNQWKMQGGSLHSFCWPAKVVGCLSINGSSTLCRRTLIYPTADEASNQKCREGYGPEGPKLACRPQERTISFCRTRLTSPASPGKHVFVYRMHNGDFRMRDCLISRAGKIREPTSAEFGEGVAGRRKPNVR